MLQHSILRRCVHSAHHRTDGTGQTDSQYDPGIGGHHAEGKAILEHSARDERSDGKTSSGVLEALMQVRSLSLGECIASLAVEEGVDTNDSSSDRDL